MNEKPNAAERATMAAIQGNNPFSTPIRPPSMRAKQERNQVKPAAVEPTIEDVPLPEPIKKKEPALDAPDALPAALDDCPAVDAASDVEPALVSESRSADGLPSYRCEFAGRDVFVGWPWYKTTNPVTAAVNVAMALDFGRDRIRFDMVIGDAMVYHSRNKIADAFLATDAKWLMMMDDDIIPSIGRPAWMRHWVEAARKLNDRVLQRHVLQKLLGHGKTLVGCAYFGRQEGGKLMCSDQSLEREAREYADRVVPVDWVGTGCLLVHRSVFDSVRASNPDLAPTQPGELFDYFRPIGHGRGEDISFCHRAKKSGHQPHVDLSVPTFHVGYKTY